MAVRQTSNRFSNRFILEIFITLLLGWLLLLALSLGLWFKAGFKASEAKALSLIESQRQITEPIKQGSLLAFLPLDKPRYAHDSPSFFNRLSAYSNQLNPRLKPLLRAFLQKAQEFLTLTYLISQYLLLKLLILIAAMPLFLLMMLAGLIDGLNQRAIRTACLGRESSYVFHRLNRYIKKAVIFLLALWLVVPVSLSPSLVFMPISLVLALMVAMTASRFKKYL